MSGWAKGWTNEGLPIPRNQSPGGDQTSALARNPSRADRLQTPIGGLVGASDGSGGFSLAWETSLAPRCGMGKAENTDH